MFSLFWKLFLSFWVALLAFALAVLLAASLYLNQVQNRFDYATPRQRLVQLMPEAEAVLAEGGLKALQNWVKHIDSEELVPILLVDQKGVEILNRPIAPKTAQYIREFSQHVINGEPPRPVLSLPNGRKFRFFYDYQGASLQRVFTRPKVMLVPFLLASFIASLVCWLLARYLSKPIETLSRATQTFASGNLGHRVMPLMGNRRDEIVDLANGMDHMAMQLQTLMQSQQTLLRDVSHELRSPLARAHAALGLLHQANRTSNHENQKDSQRDEMTGYLDQVEKELEQLNHLVTQIITVSKTESGLVTHLFTTLNLRTLIEEVVQRCTIEATQKNCTIGLSFDGALAANTTIASHLPRYARLETFYGDENQLYRAIENIVRNAIHYSPTDSVIDVAVSLEYKTDHPSHAQADNSDTAWVIIKVSDQGSGVPKAMLQKIFEPFVRVDDARTKESGGFGLGLAIAKHAVQAHGGSISAHNLVKVEFSERNKHHAMKDGYLDIVGLAITMRLPLRQAPRYQISEV